MPAITTTRVCASLPDLDHDWAIVAEDEGAGWYWTIPQDHVARFIMAREQRTISTVRGRDADGDLVLYARLMPKLGRKAA